MAEQRKRWIEPRISLGNLIVLGAMIGSLALGWGRLETGLAYHDERIQDLEEGAKMQTAERLKEARDVADMKADMRWIRDTLQRIDRDLRTQK